MTPGRLEWAGALVAGLLLRLVAAQHQAWWGDETFVLEIARLPLGPAWEAALLDLHPPLFPMLCKLWTALLGIGPSLSRGPALLAGVGMHAGAAFLAGTAAQPHRKVWATRVALWVGAIWGFLLVPGVELRHYGAAAAAAALALAGALSVLGSESPGRASRLATGGGMVLLVHLQAQGWLLVAALGLVALARRRRDLFAVVVVASLVGAPQLVDSTQTFLGLRSSLRPTLGPKRLAGPAVQLAAGFRVANVTPSQLRADPGALAWLALVGGALGLALLGLLRLRRRPAVLVLLGTGLVVAGGMAALAPAGYKARYLALLGPPWLALVVAGLAASPSPRLGVALLAIANAWATLAVLRLPVNPVHREDTRAALAWLAGASEETRPALVIFGAETLLALEGREAWARLHPGLDLAEGAAHDPVALVAAATRGAPAKLRLVASRQTYLDPARVAELEAAMLARGYRLEARRRFGDHLPAWEFHRSGDSS